MIVKTKNASYTVNDYQKVFDVLNDSSAEKILKSVPKAWNDVSPGVQMHCIHGSKVPTSEVLTYDDDFPDSSPAIETGDGDGTVNARSLEACKRWMGGDVVTYQVLEGASHIGILGKPELVDAVQKILFDVEK